MLQWPNLSSLKSVRNDEPIPTERPLPRPFRGLVRRREKWVLTWRGRALVLAILAGLLLIVGKQLPAFLCLNAPIPSQVLVVEGWAPDYALTAAISEFKQHAYTRLFVTGGPLEAGAPLSEYKTFADLGAATILRLGLNAPQVQSVPAPKMRKDRTYTSAVALKDWLEQHGPVPRRFNVVSVGAHARRTHLLFEMAFGKEARIGIISIEDQDYEPRHWWRSSHGVRATIDELVAYTYARLLFRAPSPQPRTSEQTR